MRAVRYVAPQSLRNHPLNTEIYGNEAPDEPFVTSIRENGVLEPILVAAGDVVIAGHRRRAGAIMAELTQVPVVDVISENPLELQKLLIETNRHREKTKEQRAREYKELKRIEIELARERQAAGGGDHTEEPEAPPAGGKRRGRAKDLAAEQVGMDARTADKAEEVVDAIDQADKRGHKKRASRLREKLENESVASAHREATGTAPAEPIVHDGPEDLAGRPIPDFMIPTFTTAREEFAKALAQIKFAKQYIKAAAGMPGGERINLTEVSADLDNAKRSIQFAQPYALCPYCMTAKRNPKADPNCKACKGLAYVGKETFNQSPAGKAAAE